MNFYSLKVIRKKVRAFYATLFLQFVSALVSSALIVIYAIVVSWGDTNSNSWMDYTLLGIGCALKVVSLIFFLSFYIVYMIYRTNYLADSYYIRH
jgi:hypothetical protein